MKQMMILLAIWLGVCCIEDIRKKQIHCILLFLGLIVCMASICFAKEISLFERLLGSGIGIIMLAVSIFTREAIGKADGVILIITGFCIGVEKNLELLLMSMFLCSCFGILVLASKLMKKKERLPYVPFLWASLMGAFVMHGW